jgi:predicted acyl esterase
VANQKTAVNIKLQDVMHTFKKDIKSNQIQSTWFPLIDLNPQTFVEISFAKPEDFKKQTQRVYDDSKIIFTVLK